MGLNTRKQAESLFSQIGYGRENAMPRPANKSIDRYLRKLVMQANENGEVIINVGEGYYRPRPWISTENQEYKEYVAKDISRAMRILRKKKRMQRSYDQLGEQHVYEVQGSSSAGYEYEQLRLPI